MSTSSGNSLTRNIEYPSNPTLMLIILKLDKFHFADNKCNINSGSMKYEVSIMKYDTVAVHVGTCQMYWAGHKSVVQSLIDESSPLMIASVLDISAHFILLWFPRGSHSFPNVSIRDFRFSRDFVLISRPDFIQGTCVPSRKGSRRLMSNSRRRASSWVSIRRGRRPLRDTLCPCVCKTFFFLPPFLLITFSY